MAQKLWRVVRSCCEMGDSNPIVQIHDQVGFQTHMHTHTCLLTHAHAHTHTHTHTHIQGAGGNCNVVKEIVYPLGGEVDVRAVKVRMLRTYPILLCSMAPKVSCSIMFCKQPVLSLPLPSALPLSLAGR